MIGIKTKKLPVFKKGRPSKEEIDALVNQRPEEINPNLYSMEDEYPEVGGDPFEPKSFLGQGTNAEDPFAPKPLPKQEFNPQEVKYEQPPQQPVQRPPETRPTQPTPQPIKEVVEEKTEKDEQTDNSIEIIVNALERITETSLENVAMLNRIKNYIRGG